jgi:hypothetical protein
MPLKRLITADFISDNQLFLRKSASSFFVVLGISLFIIA